MKKRQNKPTNKQHIKTDKTKAKKPNKNKTPYSQINKHQKQKKKGERSEKKSGGPLFLRKHYKHSEIRTLDLLLSRQTP